MSKFFFIKNMEKTHNSRTDFLQSICSGFRFLLSTVQGIFIPEKTLSYRIRSRYFSIVNERYDINAPSLEKDFQTS